MICLVREREVLIKPCKHLLACMSCARALDACTTCQGRIEERAKLEKCIRCRVRTSSKMFEPCGHVNACRECAPSFRSCPECKSTIERMVSIDKIFLNSCSSSSSPLPIVFDDQLNANSSAVYIKTAQRSLIKEKVNIFF